MSEVVASSISASDAFVGFSIIGRAMDGNGETIAFILTGHYDEEIKKSLCYAHKQKVGASYSPDDEVIAVHLQQLKNYFRQIVQDAIRSQNQAYQQHKDASHQQVLQELRNSNKPHEMGTVTQLAQRFNVSKSEIRRRKADGTLGELLLNATQKEEKQ